MIEFTNEFVNGVFFPSPRRGLTSIEATEFLKGAVPQVQQWTHWRAGTKGPSLSKIVGRDFPSSGKVGSWNWSRVPIPYPVPAYWHGEDLDPHEGDQWVGLLEIKGSGGERFFLFSYLSSLGTVGWYYLASTQDMGLLDRFARDVHLHFNPDVKDRITIQVQGGEPLAIKAEDDERIFLPDELQQDIEEQVFSFFEDKAAYKRLRVGHRRGFLFVGSPGNGKTLMLRRLIRQCHRRYKPSFSLLTIRRDTDVEHVAALFSHAAKHAPALVILEDMDSLTTQSKITRAAMLAELDGVGSREGLLVVGTTNNAGEIDAALVHRPSRFDRVWHFPLPDGALRRAYLESMLEGLSGETVDTLVAQTQDWSFAYLNELRITAAIISISRKQPDITEEIVMDAFDLLQRQFCAGRKNHRNNASESLAGFVAA